MRSKSRVGLLRLAVERRDLGAQAHEQRRRGHRERHDQHQQIALRRIDQAVRRGEREHDERELAALREDRGERDRLRVVVARDAARDRIQQHGLDDAAAPTQQHADELRLAHDHLDVERHADADEEQPEQQALERLDLRLDLVAVFRVGEQHAGEERAERHRDAGELHQPRGADHDQQRRRGEHLGRARARGRAEHRAQQVAAADHDGGDRRDDAHGARARRRRGSSVGCAIASTGISARIGIAATSWNSRIAKPSRPCAVWQLLALAQDLQADRGRRQRQAEPDDERALPVEPEREADAADRKPGQHELQAADAEHGAPHDPQPLRRELQADHEQHQHDAELGDLR